MIFSSLAEGSTFSVRTAAMRSAVASVSGLTENGGQKKGGPTKSNRCEVNDRKMQDH